MVGSSIVVVFFYILLLKINEPLKIPNNTSKNVNMHIYEAFNYDYSNLSKRDRKQVLALWKECNLIRSKNDPEKDLNRKQGFQSIQF